jgi:hypothetical protein
MKKLLTLLTLTTLLVNTAFAEVDKFSKEYLENHSGFSITKPIAECLVKRAIKKALKKETGANFDVQFQGYTTASIKKGIFKHIEFSAKNAKINDLPVPYVSLKTLSDYNYIDYTQNPIVFKSDMTCAYEIMMSEETINAALNEKEYQKVLSYVNKIASPIFVAKDVRIKMANNKLYIIMDYNFPILKMSGDKSFVMSTDFELVNNKIISKNVHIDTSYGNLGLNKVANLINLLNPLDFTLKFLEDDINNSRANIENINIVDNMVKVNGKIFIKGK